MATIEAIAQLAGEAGSRLRPRPVPLPVRPRARARSARSRLARDELAIRPDVYGYDTLAWALLNAGDAAGADAPMQSALAAGTKDARLWYHAGLIAAAPTDVPMRPPPTSAGALALGPALDPIARVARDRRPGDDPMRCARSAPRSAGTLLALVLVPVVAAVALAHPLGNFTINHYAGIRVEPARVVLDVVIDEAEIPTFQASQGFDLDGDGRCRRPRPRRRARRPACRWAGPSSLTVDGTAARLGLIGAGLSFPPGNGGLSTMRSVCTYEAPLASPIVAGSTIEFADGFEASRIGWREMTVVGSGVTATGSGRRRRRA